MRFIFGILVLCFSALTVAETLWFETYSGDWWVVKYPELTCVRADQYGSGFRPDYLIKHVGCVYEPEYSIEGRLASVDCPKKFNGGFLLAVDIQACNESIESIKKLLSEQE